MRKPPIRRVQEGSRNIGYDLLYQERLMNGKHEAQLIVMTPAGHPLPEERLVRLIRIARERIDKLSTKLGAFPTEHLPTTTFLFLVTRELNAPASVKHSTEKAETTIYVNEHSTGSWREFTYLLTHELYHVIAQAQHKEDEIKSRLRDTISHLQPRIDEEAERMNAQISGIAQQIGLKREDGKPLSAQRLAQSYFEDTHRFWNIFIDSAMGVLAIDMEDEMFEEAAIAEDMERASHAEQLLKALHEARKEHPEHSHHIDVLTYFAAVIDMPLHSVAWAWLPQAKEWSAKHPYKNIDRAAELVARRHGAVVRRYATTDVASAFFAFQQKYREAIIECAIRADPKDPDFTKQIYTPAAMRAADSALHQLITSFNRING